MERDPIKKLEEIAKDVHDLVGVRTQPVLRKYPLLFAFLLTFSAAAIIHGFELWADQIELFSNYPLLLMGLGVMALALTGTLYKVLRKID